MKQLELSLETVNCPHYKVCDAPLCPKDINFGRYQWFPGEPVCKLKDAPDWVDKQRKINRIKEIDTSKFFTFKMLNAIESVTADIDGVDPELVTGEKIWLTKRAIAAGTRQTRKKRSQPAYREDSPRLL